MDNAFKMNRQYTSIEEQLKSVSVLIDEIGQLSKEVGAKILDAVSDLRWGDIERKHPDFTSLYPDECKQLNIIGKKFGQGMSELKSALDYLIRFLVYKNKNTPSNKSAFLILDDNKKELSECYIQKKREKFLCDGCLEGLTCEQKLSIFLMQPAYTHMHRQAETLSAVKFHRNTYMHNTVPFITPYIVPYPSSKDRRYMDDKGLICTKHDPNSKIKEAGVEVLIYKDECRKLKGVMLRSRLYGEPDKVLNEHKETIIGVMQQLTSDVDDFDFEFPSVPCQSNS